MGFFIQISNDSGRPLFQAARNYPDVSFASSALFHALVTASLEQGFVPSIIRSDDATIALAVHGEHGARLGLAMVTSELASGRTGDLEMRLRWRLDVLYRGARQTLGPELHKAAGGQVQADAVRKVLTERLSPIVRQMMSEEEDSQASVAVKDPFGWSLATPQLGSALDAFRLLPPLGLCLYGAAVEWLMLGCSNAAEHALNQLLASFNASMPSGTQSEGTDKSEDPVGATYPAALIWRGRVVTATQAWRQSAHTDRGTLVAIANCVGPQAFGEAHRTLALEDISDLWLQPRATKDTGELQKYRMLNIRLCPDPASLPKEASGRLRSAKDSDEVSLVLSVLTPNQSSSTFFAQADELKRLREITARLSAEGSLRNLWQKLLTRRAKDTPLELNKLSAAILLDERSGDAVAMPCPWDVSADDTDIAAALRQLMYWIHTAAPLDASRPQQFICCEGYTVAGVRREDCITCWGSAATSTKQMHGAQDLVLQEVQKLLRRLPRATDLWSSLGALETPDGSMS
mmetsp:Transcript_9610/g.22457  ORF Transcript_9610/g.22457 Transcript_9610/m.22457 type:complete len:518 (-) Transcript_9610:27-1580(-)